MRGGYTYIVTNRPFGILYVGVTANIAERIFSHRQGRGSAFCRKWDLRRLVLVEPHATIEEAIIREKALKNWTRAWKLRLIAETNPQWLDLSETLNG
jgi:putative endonuclease